MTGGASSGEKHAGASVFGLVVALGAVFAARKRRKRDRLAIVSPREIAID